MEHATPPDDLDELRADIWSLLQRGAVDRRSAMHTPVFATQGAEGPAVRTVVLRDADERARRLTCHSDSRSGKVAALGENARSAWLFYEPQRKVQLRISGDAVVHQGNARTQERWARSPLQSRRCYCTAAPPGSPLAEPGEGLVPALVTRSPTEAETVQYGRPFFVVIDTTVDTLEWLWLSAHGHRRARFCWDQARWQGTWLVP